MRSKTLLAGVLLTSLLTYSCTGVKNMSGSLKKSDGSETVTTARHGNYLTESARQDSLRINSRSAVGGSTSQAGEYRRNHVNLNSGNAADGTIQKTEMSDQYGQLIKLNGEMDKLADVVLYELDITERRYNKLLSDYKSAGAESRQSISGELDQLSSNQITLYKSYVSIYKQGKADWPKVKAEVDATLLKLRGLDR